MNNMLDRVTVKLLLLLTLISLFLARPQSVFAYGGTIVDPEYSEFLNSQNKTKAAPAKTATILHYTGPHTEKNPGICGLNYSEGPEGINPLSGGLFLHRNDLSVADRNGGFPMTRFYSSKRVFKQVIKDAVKSPEDYNTYYVHLPQSGILGQGWDFHMGRIYVHLEDTLSQYLF